MGGLITVEGGIGSYKRTICEKLERHITQKGFPVVSVKDPTTAEIGRTINAILKNSGSKDRISEKTETLLYLAGRSALVDNYIAPALERGDYVICNRFVDSTSVYQAYARGVETISEMKTLNDFAVKDCWPDLTFILDCPVEQGKRRVAERGEDLNRIERSDDRVHRFAREGYQMIAELEKRIRTRLIETENLTASDTWEECKGILVRKFPELK
jgi:dTMP kinase